MSKPTDDSQADFSNTSGAQADLEQYLHHVVGLDLPIQQKIILLEIVRSVLSHFVDQAFNVQTDQLTLQSAGKSGFMMSSDRAVMAGNPENQTADALSSGAESDANPLGAIEP